MEAVAVLLIAWVTSWDEMNETPLQPTGLEDMPSWSWVPVLGGIFYKYEACEESE